MMADDFLCWIAVSSISLFVMARVFSTEDVRSSVVEVSLILDMLSIGGRLIGSAGRGLFFGA